MAYGMAQQHDGTRSPTVVYSSFLSDGQPSEADSAVVRWLRKDGVVTI